MIYELRIELQIEKQQKATMNLSFLSLVSMPSFQQLAGVVGNGQ